MMKSFKSYMLLTALLLASCSGKEPSPDSYVEPEIDGISVSGVTAHGAVLIASVRNAGSVAEQGFRVFVDKGSQGVDIPAKLEGRIFSAEISDLQEAMTYSFDAYAGNGAGRVIRSGRQSFSTSAAKDDDSQNGRTPGKQDDNSGGNGSNNNQGNGSGNQNDPGSGNSGNNGDNKQEDPEGKPDYPQVPETVTIKDPNLLAWLLWRYDSDKDGKLSKNEALKVDKIELSSTNISTLEGIASFPNLYYLHAQGERIGEISTGMLKEVDLSSNPRLQHIHLIYNNIHSIKLLEGGNVSYLDLDYNLLEEIDVKSLKLLSLLQVSFNKLKQLDVTGLDQLNELHCNGNPLTSLKLDNKALESLCCDETLISELDLSRCQKINNVDCSSCPMLKTIRLAKGQVVGNITKDPGITVVYSE